MAKLFIRFFAVLCTIVLFSSVAEFVRAEEDAQEEPEDRNPIVSSFLNYHFFLLLHQ